MTITTIIPTYNRASLLKRSINSILNQTFQDFVICVYDDNSTDETEQMVKEMALTENRIKYVKHCQNKGVMQNFIYGVTQIKTPFFNFLSDDDTVENNFFELAMRALAEYPDTAFFAGATLHCDQNGNVFGNPVGDWEKEGVYEPGSGFREMLKKAHPDWTGIVFRSSVLDRVFPDINVNYAADYDFELRLAAEFPIYVSKQVVAKFNLHTGSESFKARLHGMWPAWHYLLENIRQSNALDKTLKDEALQILSRRIIGKIFRTGLKSIVREDYNECAEAAKVLKTEFNCSAKSRMLTSSYLMVKKIWGLKMVLRNLILIAAFYRRKTGAYKF